MPLTEDYTCDGQMNIEEMEDFKDLLPKPIEIDITGKRVLRFDLNGESFLFERKEDGFVVWVYRDIDFNGNYLTHKLWFNIGVRRSTRFKKLGNLNIAAAKWGFVFRDNKKNEDK